MADSAGLKAKFRALPKVIEDALRKQVEKEAGKVVAEQQILLAVSPYDIAKHIEIDWTWGDAPAGSVVIGEVRGRESASIGVTIYARARSGSGMSAAWFEFGTAPRVQETTGRRTGRIMAQPFFFPPWRANRTRVKGNIRAALRRAVKKLND